MPGFNMDDYVPVNERIEKFLEKYPDGSLQSDIVELTASRVTVRAYAYRTPDDPRPGMGHSTEAIPGETSFTRGSELENAETSAWGRAIAALGFEVKRGIASREEMRRQQPERSEREAQAGRRGSRHPATTSAPAPRNKGEALGILADVGREHGLTFAQIEARAKSLGVDRGSSSVEDIMRVVASIETPAAGSAHPAPVASAPAVDAGEAGSSVPASPIATPSSEGIPLEGSDAATTPAVEPPPSPPGPAFTDEEILAAAGPGAEMVPPELQTRIEKARSKGKKAEPVQETLAEALGSPVVGE